MKWDIRKLDIRLPIGILLLVLVIGQLGGWFSGKSPTPTGEVIIVGEEVNWMALPDMTMKLQEFNWTECLQIADEQETVLERNALRAECYSMHALETGESTFCNEVGNQLNQYIKEERALIPKLENGCFFNFAIYYDNYGICHNIEEPRGESGLVEECLAISQRNITLCNEVDDVAKVIDCKATIIKDMFICRNHTQEGYQEACQNQVRMWGMTV